MADILSVMAIRDEKIRQVPAMLEHYDLDCWLVFVRESRLGSDPVLPLLVDEDVTWQSFFVFTKAGDAIAMVGNFDEDIFTRMGCFTEVIPYTEGVGESIRGLLSRLDPKTIGINYSQHNPSADGLSHGLYLQLLAYLEGTPYAERLRSAESVCTSLRARKTDSEIAVLAESAKLAHGVWETAVPGIGSGMTEIEIGRLIDSEITGLGGKNSFETTVNAGDKSVAGHAGPTEARLAPGDLLHIDFGIEWRGYCSDLQRLLYIRRLGERSAPPELLDAFEMVKGIITETATLCVPGARGCDIDTVARERLQEHGYPAYEHALGHQLGRSVHDGGAIIGPSWERYGHTPTILLEENNLFTLELEIILPGIGCVGLEEDICVTPAGGRFLCPRQLELTIK